MKAQQKQKSVTFSNLSQPVSFSSQTGEVRGSGSIKERIATIRKAETISMGCNGGWGN